MGKHLITVFVGCCLSLIMSFSPKAALLVLGPSLLSKICEPRIFCLLPQVLGQLLDEGHEHGLGEGVVDRVEDLGGGQQLTGEDHQGQVIGGEPSSQYPSPPAQ